MSTQEITQFIQRFLRLMEARDLEAANAMIAPGVQIIFPGGKQFASQEEMVEASKGRYQWVKKTFDQVDVIADPSGKSVAYIMGTLYGANRHGIEFSGIRYIDRFTIKDGLIVAQEVWNDLAESGVLEKTT